LGFAIANFIKAFIILKVKKEDFKLVALTVIIGVREVVKVEDLLQRVVRKREVTY